MLLFDIWITKTACSIDTIASSNGCDFDAEACYPCSKFLLGCYEFLADFERLHTHILNNDQSTMSKPFVVKGLTGMLTSISSGPTAWPGGREHCSVTFWRGERQPCLISWFKLVKLSLLNFWWRNSLHMMLQLGWVAIGDGCEWLGVEEVLCWLSLARYLL
jgi:hypothetical protein